MPSNTVRPYYAMRIVEGVPNRVGAFKATVEQAIKVAEKYGEDGYVEKYGTGVVWTPKAAMPH